SAFPPRSAAAPREEPRSWCGPPAWPDARPHGTGPREGTAIELSWEASRVPRLTLSIAQGLPSVKSHRSKDVADDDGMCCDSATLCRWVFRVNVPAEIQQGAQTDPPRPS